MSVSYKLSFRDVTSVKLSFLRFNGVVFFNKDSSSPNKSSAQMLKLSLELSGFGGGGGGGGEDGRGRGGGGGGGGGGSSSSMPNIREDVFDFLTGDKESNILRLVGLGGVGFLTLA